MDTTLLKKEVLEIFAKEEHLYKMFMETVCNFFSLHPQLTNGNLPAIHSIKKRIKDREHISDKIDRKYTNTESEEDMPTASEIFAKLTDLAGVRVLYLHNKQFALIHDILKKQFENKEWALKEAPMAYTWDPEAEKFYISLGITTEVRDTFYTSVHYLVKPRQDSQITCEIQIRSLYEEIWGEVDHSLNYPVSTSSIACKEQLRVLSKLTSTGTRLLESIYNTIDEYDNLNHEIDNNINYQKLT